MLAKHTTHVCASKTHEKKLNKKMLNKIKQQKTHTRKHYETQFVLNTRKKMLKNTKQQKTHTKKHLKNTVCAHRSEWRPTPQKLFRECRRIGGSIPATPPTCRKSWPHRWLRRRKPKRKRRWNQRPRWATLRGRTAPTSWLITYPNFSKSNFWILLSNYFFFLEKKLEVYFSILLI